MTACSAFPPQLYQAFVEVPIGAAPIREPNLLQNIVGLIVKRSVEALEKTGVMRFESPTAQAVDLIGDLV